MVAASPGRSASSLLLPGRPRSGAGTPKGPCRLQCLRTSVCWPTFALFHAANEQQQTRGEAAMPVCCSSLPVGCILAFAVISTALSLASLQLPFGHCQAGINCQQTCYNQLTKEALFCFVKLRLKILKVYTRLDELCFAVQNVFYALIVYCGSHPNKGQRPDQNSYNPAMTIATMHITNS